MNGSLLNFTLDVVRVCGKFSVVERKLASISAKIQSLFPDQKPWDRLPLSARAVSA
jgi:hypothetical protein